jgi:hypothetical protein
MSTSVRVLAVTATMPLGLLVACTSTDGSEPPALSSSGAAKASGTGTGCRASERTDVPQPSAAELEAAGLADLPLADDAARRDLEAAPFSDPTTVTNPLFPISVLDSAVLNGRVDGLVFHTETTLLPFTEVVEWKPGQCVQVLASQYTAFLDGRLQETAIDLYAQDDDGSVWYLGEDVFDYDEDGLVTTTEGTWRAGKDGPMAMIMPADPQVGDVNRPENIPGNVFEEVLISEVDQTFDGPSGPVPGGIVATEIHQDGSTSDKLFAPGYGEFLSADGKDIEALALAVPADFVPGGMPAALADLASDADTLYSAGLSSGADWRKAAAIVQRMRGGWSALAADGVPPRMAPPVRRALAALAGEVADRDAVGTRRAAVDAAYAVNDLALRHLPLVDVDTRRFELWTRRAVIDASEGDTGALRSDFVTLEWVRDRIAHTLPAATRAELDFLLVRLGVAIADEEPGKGVALSRRLLELLP